MDRAGNFYGTTVGGGQGCFGSGCGTVFRLAPDGTETVLYSFTGGADGSNPYGAVIRDNGGNLYGTTRLGGAYGFGTAFKLAADGTETVLHAFTNGKDGSQPNAALLMDRKGRLYSTADYGAKTRCYNKEGCGTVFRVKE